MGLGSGGAGDGGAGEGSIRASVHGQILASQRLQPVGGCEEIQQLADSCAVEIGDCKPIGPINKVTGAFGFYVPRSGSVLCFHSSS